MTFLAVLVASSAMVSPALAQETLYLKSGEALSGSISSFNMRAVNIETASGLVRVPTAQISGVDTANATLARRIESAMDIADLAQQKPVYTPRAAMEPVPATQQFAPAYAQQAPASLEPLEPLQVAQNVYTPEAVIPDYQPAASAAVAPVDDLRALPPEHVSAYDQARAAAYKSAPAATAANEAAAAPTPSAPVEVTETASDAAEDDAVKLFGATVTGSINVGLGMRTGNSETNAINVDGDTELKWTKHRTYLSAEYNREEEDDTVSVDDRMFELKHDYFYTDQWFIEGLGRFEQDDVAELDLRTTLAAGLGYQPFDRDDLTLKFVAGPGYRKEEFADGTDDSYMTGEWQADYSQKFNDDAFRLFHNHDLSVPVEETDSFVFTSESGIRVPLRKGIIASGQVDFDWQNNPPAGTKEDDTTYTIKLGYEW